MNQDQKHLLVETLTKLIYEAVEIHDADMDKWNAVVSELAKVDIDASNSIIAKRDAVKAVQKAVITFLQDIRKDVMVDSDTDISRTLNHWNEKLEVNSGQDQ